MVSTRTKSLSFSFSFDASVLPIALTVSCKHEHLTNQQTELDIQRTWRRRRGVPDAAQLIGVRRGLTKKRHGRGRRRWQSAATAAETCVLLSCVFGIVKKLLKI